MAGPRQPRLQPRTRTILTQIESYAEFIQKIHFDEYKKKILPMRNEIYQVMRRVDLKQESDYELELKNIIGYLLQPSVPKALQPSVPKGREAF